MSALIPNLEELRAALPDGMDASRVAAAFDTDDLPTARAALRALLASWEQPQERPGQQAGEAGVWALGEGTA